MAFIFKIQIKGITNPPVWRRVLVPEQFTFHQFHEIIQAAFGWESYHLFQFSEKGYQSPFQIGVPSEDDFEEVIDSDTIILSKIFQYEGQKYTYIYDFGDDWTHAITLEKIIDSKILQADCIDGKGACPPEDCGGPYRYPSVKDALLNPKDPEHKGMREWLGLEKGEVWDPKAFDLEEARKMVREV